MSDQEVIVMVENAGSPAFIVVSAGDIAERAYGFYLDRGCVDGFDREDWLRAERELKTPPAIAATRGSRRSPK
jgi:hypothetical protein